MGTLTWFGLGLLFLALSYWIVRHTEVKDYEGYERKWKKWTFPRWVHLVAWMGYLFIGPFAIAPTIILLIHVVIDCDMNDKRFVCDSKVWNWLTKKV